jgi:hypothetical protein
MSFTTNVRAGILALGVAALATPVLAQSSSPGGGGGPTNPATGSQINKQVTEPDNARSAGTYAPGSSSGSVSSSGQSSPSTTGAAPGSRDGPSTQAPNPAPKGSVGGN